MLLVDLSKSTRAAADWASRIRTHGILVQASGPRQLRLVTHRHIDRAAVERTLYHDSGLLGVSGISNDMRALLQSEDPRAQEAIDLFVYRIAKEVGALASALGGLDVLVFSAGIGEHAASIRSDVCDALGWLGVECDELANDRHETLISTSHSMVRVLVIGTDEEAMIAAHTAELLRERTPRQAEVWFEDRRAS